MSDVLGEAVREKERLNNYFKFLESLAVYLMAQTQENLEAVKTNATKTDAVRGGMQTILINISAQLDEILEQLMAGDKKIWGRLLLSLLKHTELKQMFEDLKQLSPFRGQILVSLDYVGYGSGISIGGELGNLLDFLIAKKLCLKTRDYDEFLVTIPPSALDDAEIMWLFCNLPGVDGPRQAE